MAKQTIQIYLSNDSKRPRKGKKLPKRLISLRLEDELIERVKRIAAKQDIPYQALIRQWIMAGALRSDDVSSPQ